MKKIILIFLCIGLISCTKSNKQDLESIQNSSDNTFFKDSFETKDYTIVSLNANSPIVSQYLSTSVYDTIISTVSSIPIFNSSYKQVFTNPNIELLYLPITSSPRAEKSVLAVYITDSTKFVESYIIEKTFYTDSTVLNYFYPNGELAVRVTLDSSNHAISLYSNENPLYLPVGGTDCIIDCVSMLWNACMQDTLCQIECAIMIDYCLGAMLITCTYECLVNHQVIGGTT